MAEAEPRSGVGGAAAGEGPLAGVRVLDVTHVMAGAWCGLLLAEMGADVVKLERPGRGDDFRRRLGDGQRGFEPFSAVNHSKRSLALDLKRPEGAEVLRRLAAGADVLVENYRPGTLERLGLGFRDLSRANPRLVYASISGFGATGPWRDRGGFDLMAQGLAGLMSLTGEPGGQPVKVGVPIADLTAGSLAALGILSALVARARTGRGQHVDTSLFEAALSTTVWESALYFGLGVVAKPEGSAHRLAAPYEAFRTRDGHLTLGAANQATFERLCAALGREDLLADPRFAGPVERLAHRRELAAILQAIFETGTTAHFVDRLNAAGVPAGPVLALDEVFRQPQVAARAMVASLPRPEGGSDHVLGPPVKLSDTPWRARHAAPALGAHSREVLAEAGVAADEIEALVRSGVVGVPPAG